MKTCTKCFIEKTEEEFRLHSVRKTRYSYCTDCHRAQIRQHYSDNKQYYIDKASAWKKDCREQINIIKSVPCKDCGQSYPPYVMDFDHLGLEDKIYNISQMVGAKGMKSILKEIDKCEIVCANCHRQRTHDRIN